MFWEVSSIFREKFCVIPRRNEKERGGRREGVREGGRERAGPYLGFLVCGGKLCTPSQGSPVYRFWISTATRNSPAKSNTMLEEKS